MTINRRSLFSIFAGLGALAAAGRTTKAKTFTPPVKPIVGVDHAPGADREGAFLYDPSHTHSYTLAHGAGSVPWGERYNGHGYNSYAARFPAQLARDVRSVK